VLKAPLNSNRPTCSSRFSTQAANGYVDTRALLTNLQCFLVNPLFFHADELNFFKIKPVNLTKAIS